MCGPGQETQGLSFHKTPRASGGVCVWCVCVRACVRVCVLFKLYSKVKMRSLISLHLPQVFELKVLSALALRRLRIPRAELEAHIGTIYTIEAHKEARIGTIYTIETHTGTLYHRGTYWYYIYHRGTYWYYIYHRGTYWYYIYHRCTCWYYIHPIQIYIISQIGRDWDSEIM